MKKLKLILTLCLITVLSMNAQKCKYSVNEIDKATNKPIKQTEPEKLIRVESPFLKGDFSIKRIDTSYYFILDYEFQTPSKVEVVANILKGDKIIFTLENKETITLVSDYEIKGVHNKVLHIDMCKIQNVSYAISKNQLNKFLNSKVITIRVYNSDLLGEKVPNNVNVKEKKQELISYLSKCIL